MTAPTDFDDATVAAYVDDELDAETRARIDAAARADETLAARLKAQVALRALLQATYDPVAQAPTPERFLHVVGGSDRPAAEVVDLASRRAPPPPPKAARSAKSASGGRRALPAWAGMAACLAVGLVVGRLALPPSTAVSGRADQPMVASGPLAKALERQLAADPPGEFRMGVSFRDGQGTYCRAFQPAAKAGVAGVACRDSDVWRLRLAMPVAAAAATAYRTARAETPPAVLTAVDAMIVGAPLDAKAEQASRDRRWRP